MLRVAITISTFTRTIRFPGEISFRYFVFTVLPFGLSSAPYISSKCLKPLEKYWRIYGVNIALFLDDGWLIDFDHNSCVALASNMRSDLGKTGLSLLRRNLSGARAK